MAKGEPEPGSGLPAPYRSPWHALAEALAAVLASVRLELRGLLRRNGQGQLPRPGFWPADLAPLFWPLLLALLLALVFLLLPALWPGSRASMTPPAGPAAADQQPAASPAASNGSAAQNASTAPQESAAAEESAAANGFADANGLADANDLAAKEGLAAAVPAEREAGPAGSPATSGGPTGRLGAGPSPAGSSPPWLPTTGTSAIPDGTVDAAEAAPRQGKRTAAVGGPEPLQLDPLLLLLNAPEDAGLLLAAQPDAASSRLSLTLAPAALALPQPSLLQRAERWRQRAAEAGYDHLELRDRQGRLIARRALVGSGMILLAPVPAA